MGFFKKRINPDRKLLIGIQQSNYFEMKDALDAGADPNGLHGETGFPFLHIASMAGDLECLKLLVDRGAIASLHLRDPSSGVGLVFANLTFRNPNSEVIDFLVKSGVKLDETNNNGETIEEFLLRIIECHAIGSPMHLIYSKIHNNLKELL